MMLSGNRRQRLIPFMPFLLCISITLASGVSAWSQIRLTEWKTYSSFANTRTVAQDRNGAVWGATSGGVFSFNLSTRQVQEFRNIDALYGLDISTLRINPSNGDVYAGGVSGIINIYNGQRWKPITDIFSATLTNKAITDMAFRDSLVFVGGNFGLTIYNANQGVFAETVARLGAFQPGAAVRQLLIAQGRIWVATASGVASAPLNLRSFINPASWTTYLFNSGTMPIQQDASGVAEYQGTIYTVSGNALWKLSDSMFQSVKTTPNTLTSIAAVGTELYIASANEVQSLSRGNVITIYSGSINALSRIDSAGTARLGVSMTTGFGLLNSTVNGNVIAVLPFNGPTANRFRQISIDKQGTVWCANGTGEGSAQVNNNGAGVGLYRLNNENWASFNTTTYPEFDRNSYYQVYAASDSTVWASSWGSGIMLLQPKGAASFTLTRFTNKNSRLIGVAKSDFVVGGGVRLDARTGTTWMTNITNDSIVARDRKGTFYAFSKPSSQFGDLNNYQFVTIDASGAKWLATGLFSGGQLWVFNDKNTLDNTADDEWQSVSELGNQVHTAIVTDRNGEIWLGTKKGLYRIVNPYAVLSSATPKPQLITQVVQKETPLETTINDVFVDAQNNKWIATNSGVWVVSEDGSKILSQINTENSPLVSNSVFSVAIDAITGRAYFGTDNGLSSAQTLSVPPSETFALRCYPQPFVPQQDTELVIDGLAGNAQVKISSLDGILIRTLNPNNSRTVIWDGRDERGDLVQSGVYLVSAYSAATSSTAVAKAMVLQR